MTIASLDQYIASAKQRVAITKTAGRTTVAAGFFSMFDLAGNPGAGTLAGSNTTNGIVPTSAAAGYPTLNNFNAGAMGYVGKVRFANTVPGRFLLFDRLFVAGAFAFNASQALSSQPSFASRLSTIPGSGLPDYKNLELWVEQVTAATGNQTVNVTYTNQDGVTGKTTGAVGISAAPTVGRCWQLPFAAGDNGIQTISNVVGGTGTAGTFNVMILRPLWEGRVIMANYGDMHDIIKCGAEIPSAGAALYALFCPDSTALGVPDLNITIVNG